MASQVINVFLWSHTVAWRFLLSLSLLVLITLLAGCGGDAAAPSPGVKAHGAVSLPVNATPKTSPDTYKMLSTDHALQVPADNGVLKNDTDADGDSLHAVLVSPPAHHEGVFQLNQDGGFQYMLNDPDILSDSFVYRAADQKSESVDTLVTINIVPNNAPVGEDDNYRIIELNDHFIVPANGGVLSNDTGHYSTHLIAELVTAPAHNDGKFTLNPDGSFDYKILPSDATSDTFTYVAVDGKYRSKPINVTLVFVQNTPPRVKDLRQISDASSEPLVGDLSSVVSDDENSVFNYFNVTPDDVGNQGQLTIDRVTGEYAYTPFTGHDPEYQDVFTYQVDDLHGGTATGSLTFVIGPRRIMPLGDSITYGVTSSGIVNGKLEIGPPNDLAVGYRLKLSQLLDEAGCAYDFVGSKSSGGKAGLKDTDHQGTPGIRSQEVDMFITTWLNENPPDIILLHIGSNNFAGDGLSDDVTSIDSILTKIRQWAKAHDNPVKVVIAKIIDQYPFNNIVGAFNANLQALIENKWPEVILVDQYAALSYPDDIAPLSVDISSMHPTMTGYGKMAETWFGAIRKAGLLRSCRE